ncbi:MAG: DUF1015 domain-containing protein [Sphaerochaeta sp.]|jgi:hypothetical protein|nr:DUF1015 domain-containing protein [Sphaerochaeta sp.]
MQEITQRLAKLGIRTADILVPHHGIDLKKWAVVACDQYTSEPEYWKRVEQHVGNDPSTLRLIYPEVYLNEADKQQRIEEINQTMRQYLEQNIFDTYPDSFFLVHRKTEAGRGRWGLLVALDLECYDYSPESKSLVRATEGTILSRIPPRKEIRKNALLEVPHIMVLLDDPKRTVIEPLAEANSRLPLVYDTDLMEHGGHVTAWKIDQKKELTAIASALEGLYDALDPANPLLYAMGDGNHSLATAKSCWEDLKKTLPSAEQADHPARFALVELENIHDPGLVFEPIHRLLFHTTWGDVFGAIAENARQMEVRKSENLQETIKAINQPGAQKFGYLDQDGWKVITLTEPSASIAAGTIQNVIDGLTRQGKAAEVDYVHGTDVVEAQGKLPGNAGILLPDVSKQTFFATIIKDKALPRKTFSMGDAAEKRFYMEARKIR